MKIKRNAQAQKRGLDRFDLDLSAEHKRGLVPQRYVRKDATGKPFTTKTAAKEHWDKVLTPQINAGGVDSSESTIGDCVALWQTWLADKLDKQKIGREHFDNDISFINRHVGGFRVEKKTDERIYLTGHGLTLRGVRMFDVRVSSITTKLMHQELIVGGQIDGLQLAPNTKQHLLAVFTEIFDFALREGWMQTNPIASLKWIKPEDHNEETVNHEAIEDLRGRLPRIFKIMARLHPEFVLAFKVMQFTGLRINELRALNLASFKKGNRSASLMVDKAKKKDGRIGGTKAKKDARIPVDVALLNELEKHAHDQGLERDGFLFPASYQHMLRALQNCYMAERGFFILKLSPNYRILTLTKDILEHSDEEIEELRYPAATKGRRRTDGVVVESKAAMWKHCGVPPLGTHAFRHLFASSLLSNNVDVNKVVSLMRHADERTIRSTYEHYLIDEDRDLADIDLISNAVEAA